ncbi:MAG: hypothetical protein ACR2NM_02615, partial [Bythopirellula sp.]
PRFRNAKWVMTPILAELDVVMPSRWQFALTIVFVLAIIGMPLVLSYTAIVYWTFRGKVKIDGYG